MTEKQIITDKERIQHLEEKIKRQRADLSRLYRERDERVEELERELRRTEVFANKWRTLYEDLRKRWRNSEERYDKLVEQLKKDEAP